MLSWTTSYALLMIALVGFISLGMRAFLSCSSAAVARWFARKRARAMAASSLGFSMGATVLPPLLSSVPMLCLVTIPSLFVVRVMYPSCN